MSKDFQYIYLLWPFIIFICLIKTKTFFFLSIFNIFYTIFRNFSDIFSLFLFFYSKISLCQLQGFSMSQFSFYKMTNKIIQIQTYGREMFHLLNILRKVSKRIHLKTRLSLSFIKYKFLCEKKLFLNMLIGCLSINKMFSFEKNNN